MKKKLLTLSVIQLFFSFTLLKSQQPVLDILTTGTNTSLRGLSVVNDNVIWVSGNNGTVGRSTNGGKNWKWMIVTGFEKTDFRDIEAFDASTAIIMGISTPAYILKTTDGGASWKVVYENKSKDIFLDAMEFWNEQAGIVVGDPIDGRFFISRTFNGGSTWEDLPFEKRPVADSGEACFAASGTNICVLDRDEAVFVSGGRKSRLYKRNKIIPLPLIQGKETTGANSISVWDKMNRNGGKKIIIVGGDFNDPVSNANNCAISKNGGENWFYPKIPPHGYRSCVEFLSNKDILTCGLNGVDYSKNGGRDFEWFSKESFNVCRIAKYGQAVYLAGNNGKIGKIIWK